MEPAALSPTQQPDQGKLVALSLFKIQVAAYICGLEYLLVFVFVHRIRLRGGELPQPYHLERGIPPPAGRPRKKPAPPSPVEAFSRSAWTLTTWVLRLEKRH